MCHKVKHLLPEEDLNVYSHKFLNKPIAPEYYVDTAAEVELKAKFL